MTNWLRVFRDFTVGLNGLVASTLQCRTSMHRAICRNFSRKISVPQLSRIARMSEASFYKKFRMLLGSTPADFIINKRLDHSKALLRRSERPIGDVVFEFGFGSFEYFCRKFREKEVITPHEYRDVHRGNGAGSC